MLKISDYIIKTKYKDGFILFHGYSGNIIFLTSETYDKFSNNMFYKLDNNILTLLKKQYFLIDSNLDEKTIIENIYNKIYNFVKNYIQVTILLTYDCNFACKYCYEAKIIKNQEFNLNNSLNKEKINKIFDFINQYNYKNVKSLTLYGGEPFLHSNKESIEYILKMAKEYNIKYINAITNGYEIDFFNNLIKSEDYFISTLQITIDGPPKIHNKRRMLKDGGKTYEKIMKNISYYLNKNININIRVNVDNENLDSLKELKNIFYEYGFLNFKNFYFNISNVIDNYEKNKNYLLSESFVEKYKFENNICNNDYDYYENMIYNMLKERKSYDFRIIACGAMINQFVFDPLGKIYKCWDLIGNEEYSIGEYYPKIRLKNSIFNFDFKNNIENINCKNCKYILICTTGCKAKAYKKFNSINYGYCTNIKETFDHGLYKGFDKFINSKYKIEN